MVFSTFETSLVLGGGGGGGCIWGMGGAGPLTIPCPSGGVATLGCRRYLRTT